MTRRYLLPGRIVDDPRGGVGLVTTTLSNWGEPWLLVFDNFDIPDFIQFFPDSSCGRILITSRSTFSRELGEVIEVERMEKDEGVELLLHSSQVDAKDAAAVEKILSRVEYLPLAIDQVRAYISKQRLCLDAFEEEYERRKRKFMKETPPVWQYRRALPGNSEMRLSLLTTWELSSYRGRYLASHSVGEYPCIKKVDFLRWNTAEYGFGWFIDHSSSLTTSSTEFPPRANPSI